MHYITVLGLSGEFVDLSGRTVSYLSSGAKLILRTKELLCIREIDRLAPGYETLDALYDNAEDFNALNGRIVETLMERAKEEDVLYGVEDPRDESVGLLMERAGDRVRLVGNSFSDAALLVRMRGPGMVLAAADVMEFEPDASVSTLIREIDGQLLASEVKLRLMTRYPDEHPVLMRLADEGLIRCPLVAIDRQEAYSHRVAVLVPPVGDLFAFRRYGFSDLVKIVARLRGEGGCPWDRKQTHESLRQSILEEAYEVCDEIDGGEALQDELGDLLMLIVMQARIGADHGEFDIDDVVSAICEKMIRRHPHIFAEAVAETEAEVRRLWEKVKDRERNTDDPAEKMASAARGLPALMRADKIQRKAAEVGFDFSSAGEAYGKLLEEIDELRAAMENRTNIEEELGDILFSVVNVARLLGVSAEAALNAANHKFSDRFIKMCARIRAEGRDISSMTLKQMDEFWNVIKHYSKNM